MRIVRDIVYRSDSPKMNRLDVYLPDGKATAAYLYLHGGGITHGDKANPKLAPMYEAFTDRGIAVFSANYRFLPITDHDIAPRITPVEGDENDVAFPVFIEDCANAFRFMMQEGRQLVDFERAFIGGSSAGGYISMMLCFDRRYLAALGYDSFRDVSGYVFDAGQPTTHFHLLELRNESALRVHIDEAAPFYYLRESFAAHRTLPRLQFFTAENDMPGRVEQNALFIATLKNFDYPVEKIANRQMAGYGHCKYLADPEYLETVGAFLTR